MSFETVTFFEREIANFFGAPHAVAVDCCTHAIELCMRYTNVKECTVPPHTYISVPFTVLKLGNILTFSEIHWEKYYKIGGTDIIDAATLWERDSYIPGTYMCLSFQFQKHLSLGRGGMILCDDDVDAFILRKMAYDGRVNSLNKPWREQNITSMGYHYYMTPETAQLGLDKLTNAIQREPRIWSWNDYPDLRLMEVFNR